MKNICDWNNCKEIGEFKAPKEKDNSKDYRLLCINHIKEFNKSWNYFSGMNEEEIINFLKSDVTWHKPTQSFTSSDNFFKVLWQNVLNDKNDIKFQKDSLERKKLIFDHNDIKSFQVLGVPVGLKWTEIKIKFKKLVKIFHPDMNAGDKKHEEKLKLITLAYTQLKKTYRVKN
ncbi:MAG: molecular chaperone DnaJ [Candidatus Pelagibacter sp. TMED275]|nr:MAG: molecular chaperone DnaJ [Candidatus Pelagibacter sp. TMED275]|tara:strand:- start:5378 stop:5896 length:519 start_codon:yes stop_codon:yes gene_type:complete